VNRKADFLQKESIRIDSHNESNRIDSNHELECSKQHIGGSEPDATKSAFLDSSNLWTGLDFSLKMGYGQGLRLFPKPGRVPCPHPLPLHPFCFPLSLTSLPLISTKIQLGSLDSTVSSPGLSFEHRLIFSYFRREIPTAMTAIRLIIIINRFV